ncbi:MAG: CpaD family pilus assembly protein [Caulobacter sp.]|nr:CpaD family pilus assembly protein [Caulobacter sp.]
MAAAAVTVTGLAACASTAPDPATTPRLDTQKWEQRVQVEAHPDEILLVPHAEGLSLNQQQALDALLQRWLELGAREIVVSAPVGSAQADVAGRMAGFVRARLVGLGAPASAVRIVGYDATSAPNAPLKVGFLRHEAVVPRCGMNWENVTATAGNQAYENFGCAVAANMAAQTANAEDLLRPRDQTPPSASRRDTVINKYRKGETTASARDEQAVGAVSKAVN